MYYKSTRHEDLHTTLSAAICLGLAQDGGLFVPDHFPQVDLTDFSPHLDYPHFAKQTLQAYFKGDPLANQLMSFCQQAFSFPIPLKKLDEQTFMLELFHGPTLSFKDFGARFLAQVLNAASGQHKITIMVATSGDTGSAVASAFHQKENIRVIVLYPKDKISPEQQHQIACWQDNILACEVLGNFDDCQRLVKSAFADAWWQNTLHISSANSINIGRLIPQITYYAFISFNFYHQYQCKPGFIVPTGNLGNATAAYWAQAMGFPIREIVLATNANKVIPDYLATGQFQAQKSIATLANAMDVGNPSNLERLQHLFSCYEILKKHVSAFSVDDTAIKNTISWMYQHYHTLVCPHTATACYTRQKLDSQLPWIIVSTADPSKFSNVIEPILHKKVPVPPQLQLLLQRPTHGIEVAANLEKIAAVAKDYFGLLF